MDGVKLGSPNSIRDRILTYVKHRIKNEEELRTIVLLKALLMDPTSPQSVNDFNETIQKLYDTKTSTKKKRQTPEDVRNLIKDFEAKFPKLKEKKLKNFKRAD